MCVILRVLRTFLFYTNLSEKSQNITFFGDEGDIVYCPSELYVSEIDIFVCRLTMNLLLLIIVISLFDLMNIPDGYPIPVGRGIGYEILPTGMLAGE